MLHVFEADYQLEYSDSYSGTVDWDTIIEAYQYCTSLQRAFESLISDGYTNFILTIGGLLVLLSTVIVIWGLKYLILMPEIYMAEGILKVHVYCLKYHHWLAWLFSEYI